MMIKHNKIIGIIGGMGPEAGCKLHSLINLAAKEIIHTKRDADYPEVIHFSMPETITDRTDYLLGLSDVNPANAVIPMVQMLAEIGQQLKKDLVVCVACNTFHASPIWDGFNEHVSKIENIKIVHLIDVTVEAIQEELAPTASIAILGTIGSIKESVYESRLGPLGYEIVDLTPQQQQDVHKAIYDHEFGLKATSRTTETSCQLLESIVKSLKEQGVDRIILGSTELSIAFSCDTDVIFVDPLAIAAKKLVYISLEQ
jgi:aspartate racemase